MKKFLLLTLLWTVSLVRITIVTAGSFGLYVIGYFFFYGADIMKSEDYIIPSVGAVTIFFIMLLRDTSWVEKKYNEYKC